MARITTFVVFAIAASALSYGEFPARARRDKALEAINACLRRNEVSSHECKHLNQNVEALVEVYRGGDKSVLATLFRFTYLTDSYDEALLSDPGGFLTAMVQLSKKERAAVAAGIAGGMFRLRDAERFKAIRALLAKVPDSSPTKEVAEISLKALEANNASWFVSYFPPQTFTGRSADFRVSWFSRDMYALGEKPLWTPSSANETTYRFTYLGAFTGPKEVTLTVLTDGTGQATMNVLSDSRDLAAQPPAIVSEDQVSDFLKQLDRSHFWDMSTESQQLGHDGAEWILEGVHNGRYHIAVRWCPNLHGHPSEDAAFGEAGRFLFELAGHKLSGTC